MLQADSTTHPAWTGKKAGLSIEDERIAKVLGRFQGFVADTPPSKDDT
jgi:ribosomal protein L31